MDVEMITYYSRLAMRSLARNSTLTALMVLAIGLGIGAAMTMRTVLHVMTQDPLPQRSGHLYYPHLDPLPRDYGVASEWGDPGDNFTWPDAMALLGKGPASHQAAMAGGSALAWPRREGQLPVRVPGRFATAGFFPMFGVSLRTGRAWSQEEDAARARVVVLASSLARRLFAEGEALGSTVRLDDADFRVIGIAEDWAPQPLFYADASSEGGFGEHDEFFIPLQTAMELDMDVSGHIAGWGEGNGLRSASTTWLQVWVQLDDPGQVAAYQRFLQEYAAQQHALGRFERPPGAERLYSLMGWLRHQRIVPADVRLQSWAAMGFLVVCMVNVMALLLAKFLRRSSEVGVRRALGARRRDILLQFGTEAAMIGIGGAIAGVCFAQVGLWAVRLQPDSYAALVRMDAVMLATTIVTAVLASVIAGLLPAWRASRILPALQVKEN